MKFAGIAVSRSAKVNLGNYENTDVTVTVSAELEVGDDIFGAIATATEVADKAVAEKVDEIEIGQRRQKSKAGRFGV